MYVQLVRKKNLILIFFLTTNSDMINENIAHQIYIAPKQN